MRTFLELDLASGLWSDDQSSIAIALNPVLHNRTKHIAIKHQYVNECVQNGTVVIDFVRSKDNYADMFTKPVGPLLFKLHYGFVMEIPRILKKIKTVEEDRLSCPFCLSSVLG